MNNEPDRLARRRALDRVSVGAIAVAAVVVGWSSVSAAAPIRCGETLVRALPAANATDVHTFEARAGERVVITIDADGPAGFLPCWTLRSPAGDRVGYANQCGRREERVLPATGVYTIEVTDDSRDAHGTYRLRVEPLSATFNGVASCGRQVGCGAHETAVLPGRREAVLFRFAAREGDLVALSVSRESSEANFQPRWTLFDPAGREVGYPRRAGVETRRIPVDGTYMVHVTDLGLDGAGTFSFRLEPRSAMFNNAPNCAVPIGCGASVDGSLRNPVAGETYQFAGQQGEVVAIGINARAARAGFSPRWTLLNAAGGRIGYGERWALETRNLPYTGTYTILVEDDGNDTRGDYNLRLEPVSARFNGRESCARPISCGQTLSSVLPYPVAADSFSFEGRAGESVTLQALRNSPTATFVPCWTLHAPNGAIIGYDDRCERRESRTLPVDGRYTIRVTRRIDSTSGGSYDLKLEGTCGAGHSLPPTLTPTVTPTLSPTPAISPSTPTRTPTPSATRTDTPTATPTRTHTSSPTPTRTFTPTFTAPSTPGMCRAHSFSPMASQRPRVMLVVDKSGSMDNPGAGFAGTKWNGAKNALTTVVNRLENQVDFGLMLYPNGNNTVNGCRAGAVNVGIGASRAAAIVRSLNDARPGGNTPTTASLATAGDYLVGFGEDAPKAIILATDGGPNCNTGLDPATCRCSAQDEYCRLTNFAQNCLDDARSFAVSRALNAANIPVFVIGIPGSEDFVDVLDGLAIAGGTARGAGRRFYEATDPNSLVAAIESITERIRSCRFDLPAAVPAGGRLSVRRGGTTIPWDSSRNHGWDLVDEDTVEVFGSSCEAIVATASVVTVDVCSGADAPVTFTPTRTPTSTPTVTPTATWTRTWTPTVTSTPTWTITPTPRSEVTRPVTPTVTPTRPREQGAVQLEIRDAFASSAGKALVVVSLLGNNVGGTQNDILFDHRAVRLRGVSACTINPAIGTSIANCDEDPGRITAPCKTLSRNLVDCGQSPTAPGCEGVPSYMSRFRGIVAATAVANSSVIPSGSILYRCEFDVVDASALPASLLNANPVGSDPLGVRLDAEARDGMIFSGAFPSCPGDCNGDGEVTVDEVITAVNIALGNLDASVCKPADPSADDHVTVDEVVTGINVALNGCP